MAIRDAARAVKVGEDATDGSMTAASARELLLVIARCRGCDDCLDAVFRLQARLPHISAGR